jgi:sec-independent protein translocase protein TatB
MLDLSWGEIMVVGAVALIVIGPKDLPKALRTLGNTVGKIRRMAGEFQSQFAEAMREAELDDVRKQIQGVNDSVGSLNPIESVRSELKSAVEGSSQPAAQSRSSDLSSVPSSHPERVSSPATTADRPVALPSVSVPPVADPMEAAGLAINQQAEAQDRPAPPETKPVERTE